MSCSLLRGSSVLPQGGTTFECLHYTFVTGLFQQARALLSGPTVQCSQISLFLALPEYEWTAKKQFKNGPVKGVHLSIASFHVWQIRVCHGRTKHISLSIYIHLYIHIKHIYIYMYVYICLTEPPCPFEVCLKYILLQLYDCDDVCHY